MTDRSKQQLALSIALWLIAIGFHQLVWHLGNPNFLLRDDNLTKNLPLIWAHTEITAQFQIPRMIWSLGAGWDPFQSGEMSLFYPPYLVAYLLCEQVGNPFLFFDFSYLLHQLLLALFAMRWAPGELKHRFLLACCFIFLPNTFLLAMSWHNYGTQIVWWIGVILFTQKESRLDKPFDGLKTKLTLMGLIGLFFWSAHLQMFVWGMCFLVCWIFLSDSRRQRWRFALLAVTASLPLGVLLFYFRSVASQSAVLLERSSHAIYDRGETWDKALGWIMLGNLDQLLNLHLLPNTITTPTKTMQTLISNELLWAGKSLLLLPTES